MLHLEIRVRRVKMRQRNETLLTAKSFYLQRILNLKRFLKVKVRIVLYNASLLKNNSTVVALENLYTACHTDALIA